MHRRGFSLIETVLSISIFMVTIIVLLAMLGPVLSSLDDVQESDELSSIVESLNSFLQANSSLAVNGSNFDLIYEAVKTRGFATVYIFVHTFQIIHQVFNYRLVFPERNYKEYSDGKSAKYIILKMQPVQYIVLF